MNMAYPSLYWYHEGIFLLQFAACVALMAQNYGYTLDIGTRGGLAQMKATVTLVMLTMGYSRGLRCARRSLLHAERVACARCAVRAPHIGRTTAHLAAAARQAGRRASRPPAPPEPPVPSRGRARSYVFVGAKLLHHFRAQGDTRMLVGGAVGIGFMSLLNILFILDCSSKARCAASAPRGGSRPRARAADSCPRARARGATARSL